MKNYTLHKIVVTILLATFIISCSNKDTTDIITSSINKDFSITQTNAIYDNVLEQIIMSIDVEEVAGNTVPTPIGKTDGAPVLGYVFPTSLKTTDVGFNAINGIVALALTSHPDFDDTPLWDENNDTNYQNDGIVWHPHWVILNNDTRIKGNLSVVEFDSNKTTVMLPPTNPGMPMYMDSPGYQVIQRGSTIKVVFPAAAVNHVTDFNFDAVTAFLKVNTSNPDLPLLGVYEVYDIASKDLSLPYTIQN
ncbi:hypothetical protein [Tenacibaculum salmonis]|uniref:hypothetical protein n=1 Tax=Tenacibaculum sp. P3-BQ1 TaxID=3232310 RepID=UPI0034DF71AE